MPAESELEAKVRKYATSKGCLFWKFTSPGTNGVPDRIIIGPGGQMAFLELKAPGEKPSAQQLYWLSVLSDRIVPSGWSSDYQECVQFINDLLML